MRQDVRLRVLVATDSFGSSLSARQAADAVAAGWTEEEAADELDLLPLSDGGPGFLEVLRSALGGRLSRVPARDPLGRPVTGELLSVGGTCYVESSQACGLHLLSVAERDPWTASTAGVGDLLRAALERGPERVVVGLGGSATNDGGAGLLAEMGLVLLDRGERRLRALPRFLPALARATWSPTWRQPPASLSVAADVASPLLGEKGASRVYAPQKGADPASTGALDEALARLAAILERDLPGARGAAAAPGAGAAGGLGFALLVLGARVGRGIDLVLESTGARSRIAAADLVVTGEGSLDHQSLEGKVVSGVARAAAEAGVPCIAIAGQVALSAAERRAAGIARAYAVAAEAGSVAESLTQPRRHLESLARRAARESHRPG